VVRISAQSIQNAIQTVAKQSDCDAIFLSCTNLRTLTVIEPIEARLDLPVLSSNQLLAWHLGQVAGFSAEMKGIGRLFET
jgi:maleate isomerase